MEKNRVKGVLRKRSRLNLQTIYQIKNKREIKIHQLAGRVKKKLLNIRVIQKIKKYHRRSIKILWKMNRWASKKQK